MNMFELMVDMLEITETEEIKKDKDFQILKGVYKIPNSIGEVIRQNKLT